MSRPLTAIERMVDAACGFDRISFQPKPEKIPTGQIKLVCPDCNRCCYIRRGYLECENVLSFQCPDCQKKNQIVA